MKHTWKLDEDGDIDDFAYNTEGSDSEMICNGPVCKICGFSFCHHCNPYGYYDNTCPGEVNNECGKSSHNDEISVFSHVLSMHPDILQEQPQLKMVNELKNMIIKGDLNVK